MVDTGHWLPGRKVLVPPGVLRQPNWTASTFPVALPRKQVEKSPDIDTDKPASRQQEMELQAEVELLSERLGSRLNRAPAAAA